MPIDVASQPGTKLPHGINPWPSPIHARSIRQTVLAYHELTRENPAYKYALDCKDFEGHLQLVAQLRTHDSGAGPLTLSFDDGHISNYISARPLLDKYSCKGTFFVIAGRIGQLRDFMTWEQLKELVALGHTVCSHGWSHRFLTGCSDPELRTELVRSKQELEDRLGVAVDALSAPHGRWDHRVAAACSEAGYRRLYTSSPWMSPRRVLGLEIIGRLMVTRSMDSASLFKWLTMSRARSGLHRIIHSCQRSLRLALGDGLYHRLWTIYSGWEGPNDVY